MSDKNSKIEKNTEIILIPSKENNPARVETLVG
jgi:hypothetical protein